MSNIVSSAIVGCFLFAILGVFYLLMKNPDSVDKHYEEKRIQRAILYLDWICKNCNNPKMCESCYVYWKNQRKLKAN